MFIYWCFLQMGGAKIARLGLLFNANQDAGSSSLLFVKVLRFTISSYRLVKCSTRFGPANSTASAV